VASASEPSHADTVAEVATLARRQLPDSLRLITPLVPDCSKWPSASKPIKASLAALHTTAAAVGVSWSEVLNADAKGLAGPDELGNVRVAHRDRTARRSVTPAPQGVTPR